MANGVKWVVVIAIAGLIGGGVFWGYKKKHQKTPAMWMEHVTAATERRSAGAVRAQDKLDNEVVIEWQKTIGKEQGYKNNINNILEVTCQSMTDVEVDFLREFPSLVETDSYYESFKPLFSLGQEAVDWAAVSAAMFERIKTILSIDIASTNPDDIYFFATVKQAATQELLGAAVFLIAPWYAYGDVKVMSIGVKPEAQGRGLGKLLMSSVFTMVPECERIFLATRVTNKGAQNAYFAWGFTREESPTTDPHYTLNPEHWIFFEYWAKSSFRLQDVTKTFVPVR